MSQNSVTPVDENLVKMIATAVKGELIGNFDGVNKGIDEVKSSIPVLQQDYVKLKDDQTKLQQDLNDLRNKVSSEIAEECRVHFQRQLRKMNLVIMGLTEELSIERSVLSSLFNAILPGYHLNQYTRIGQQNMDSNSVRPVRVIMDSAVTVSQVLSNCKKLKGLDEFKNISVRRDLTRIQQHEIRRSSDGTTSSDSQTGPSNKSSKINKNKINYHQLITFNELKIHVPEKEMPKLPTLLLAKNQINLKERCLNPQIFQPKEKVPKPSNNSSQPKEPNQPKEKVPKP